jgi:enediyne core biosynthesis thioesterase
MRSYEIKHVVGFEETNLVGNVYYANHLRWQGRCREMFLRDQAPSVLDDLRNGLALVTTHCSCDYYEELMPFDEIVIRMTLRDISQSRVTMDFEYRRGASLIARGAQQIACMRKKDGVMEPAPVPPALREALT